MNVLEIQEALNAKGFNPGPRDGIRGRQTIDAIIRFQEANGLVADGIVGPMTAARLFTTMTPKEKPALSVELPWFVEAWEQIGTKEFEGRPSNVKIVNWGRDLDIAYGDDSVPWCGLFVAHCIGSQLTRETLPPSPLWARGWREFGNSLEVPQPGAVMVFWRGRKDGPNGHVGFYAGEEEDDDGAYHILGGNQSDKVCVTRVPKSKFLGARWPSTVPPANGGPNYVAPDAGRLFNDAG